MAFGGYDGSIRINTSIDAKGMAKGTQNITRQFSGIVRALKVVGAAVGLAFSGRAVFQFSKSVMESFDLMNSSVGGNIQAISKAFDGLKSAFAGVIAQLIIALTPAIIIVIGWITRLLQLFGAIIQVLFGVQKGMGAVASSTNKAGKAAKGALAPFDELNVLQKPGDSADAAKPVLPELEIPQSMIDKVQQFKDKVMEFLQPLIDAFAHLWEVVEPIIKPIWDNFLVPLGQWAADKVVKGLEWLTEKLEQLATWIEENPEEFRKIVAIILTVIVVLAVLAIGIYLLILAWTALSAIITFVSTVWIALVGIIAFLASPIGLVILAIIALIAIIVALIVRWDDVKKKAAEVWTTILQLGFIFAFLLLTKVINPIKETWGKALDFMGEKFKNIFNGIKDFLKMIINSIIDYLNGMVAAFIGGINAIIAGANAAGQLLGGEGFAPMSFVSAPRIPKLATGAVIPPNAQFAAILGDQRGGKNLEAPEDLIRQIIREEMSGNNSGGEIVIKFTGSTAELVRLLKPEIDKENSRVGKNLTKPSGSVI